MYEELRKAVCDANIELQKKRLVIYSWGNVSGIDRSAGVVAIKPSGLAYDELTDDKIVLIDLDGNVVEGDLNPSSDTPHRTRPPILSFTGISRPSAVYVIPTHLLQRCGRRAVRRFPASAPPTLTIFMARYLSLK